MEAGLALLDQLVAGALPHYQINKRYVRRDGSLMWSKVSVSLVRDEADRPLHFVAQVEDVTEVRAAQEELQRWAWYDPLTGLANRNLLLDRMAQVLVQRDRDQAMVAVAVCDLDHFKRINDSLGHPAGDRLLREVARRMQDAVRGGDTVARIGGDEFVLLLSEVVTDDEATAVLERVKAAVEAPIGIAGQELVVYFSAGLAIAASNQSAEALLRDAETALYAAKGRGRSRWELYSGGMRQRALMQLSIESELRRAIEQDEFELHYQPIVDLRTGQGVAYEALLRWRHPQRGLVLPGGFLDIAEESQLIVPLGELVLRHACRFLARHPQARWRVFVNVSPVQIGRGLLSAVILELDTAGVPASRLGLEITENAVLDATGPRLREMQQLADMGINLLMDDFGTGYSALTSLFAAPISGIKLDRSFTARLGDGGSGDRITATVGDLVASLGAHGVVEGIETVDQRRRALSHGWTYGQGYLLGRPVAEADLVLLDDEADVSSDFGAVAISVLERAE
ncbi:MAG: EAL domain-containing protein [Actinomycetota bacterium]|nr:EAL domain-containing protein [Actinomycetota bacterium]